jgi:glycosyltransferase involved in cell wall biosynthesis
MKCLFVALDVYSGVGGMQDFNRRVLRALAEMSADGVESAAVVLWDPPEQSRLAPHNVPFLGGGRNKVLTAARFLRNAWSMQPDVLLCGHLLLSPLALIARLLSPRSRNILVVHGWEVWTEPFRRRVPLWERWAVRLGIDEVVSVSRFTAGQMMQSYGLPETIFHLLPNAVDLEEDAVPPRRSGHASHRLLTVTRLSGKATYKGCDQVIRAMPRILASFHDAVYDIAGGGGLQPELERLAEKVGVRDRVRFHGCVEDAERDRLYESAGVMVMPSTGEGFGIVFLEAWRHGLPVVAGNRDASPEVVADGVNGLCVDPRSTDAIADAVVALMKDPERARDMGMSGYRTLTAQFTQRHFQSNLQRILICSRACMEAGRKTEPA